MPLYQVIELEVEEIEILGLIPGLETLEQVENLTSSQFS